MKMIMMMMMAAIMMMVTRVLRRSHWPTLNFSIGLATSAIESKLSNFVLHKQLFESNFFCSNNYSRCNQGRGRGVRQKVAEKLANFYICLLEQLLANFVKSNSCNQVPEKLWDSLSKKLCWLLLPWSLCNDENDFQLSSYLIFVIFNGPRYPWGPIYGSESL